MISRRALLRAGAGVGAAAAFTAASANTGSVWAAGSPPWGTLRDKLSGHLVLPTDSGYDLARQLQLAQFDAVHPQAVAYCANSADVTACIRFAQDNYLPVAPRSGGHSYGGYSTSPGLVIDVSRLNGVQVGQNTVRLGPGGQGVDIAAALAPHNVQVCTGTCPTVCVGGWLQGGGLGQQARKFGMGCDRLVSAEVVLADGSVVRCSSDRHPELYWALRGGGGGNFGVVTEYEVLSTQAPAITNYNLNWAWSDAIDVIMAWQQWVAQGPRELSAELLIEFQTDSASGTQPLVVATGGYLGAKADCDRLLNELVSAVGRPNTTRDVVEQPYQQAMMTVFGCGDHTVAQCHRVGYSSEAQLPRDIWATQRNLYFREPLSRSAASEALTAFLADNRGGQFRFFGLFAYGGRINDVAPTDTAFVHRDSLFAAGYQIGLTQPNPTQADIDSAQGWVNRGYTTLDPYSNHESFQNYMDPALGNWRQAYYGQNYTRLQHAKRCYDPYRFFHFAQSID